MQIIWLMIWIDLKIATLDRVGRTLNLYRMWRIWKVFIRISSSKYSRISLSNNWIYKIYPLDLINNSISKMVILWILIQMIFKIPICRSLIKYSSNNSLSRLISMCLLKIIIINFNNNYSSLNFSLISNSSSSSSNISFRGMFLVFNNNNLKLLIII